MRERRSVIAPPEMMKGSTSGSVSSNSSARTMGIRDIQKVQLAAAPLQVALGLEREEPRDQPVLGMKHERVQRSLSARPGGRGVRRQGNLEERVDLDGGAASTGVLQDHPSRGDVAGAAEVREPRA